ncbi:MAG TPA: ethylbenzene dehydrogenase-related protein [Gemmataceae bacterium]|nr:ethylbenzene dehydrogenase-related protein [Gemmataceae bacterium]
MNDRPRPTGGSGRKAVLVVAVLAFAAILVFIGYKLLVPRPPEPGPPDGTTATGPELYANHCAACHGDKGDGNGPAARFLYPKPRNFGEGKFRLVTTANGVPSDGDLLRVITYGMPGSAMFAFGHLPEADRQALVAHVRKLTREGVEAEVKRQTEGRGNPLSAEEFAEVVKEQTEPGPALEIPADLPAFSAASVARGHELYKTLCASCHGAKGTAEGVIDQKNTDGMPTRPRDFTRGVFKGGRDPRDLYARIRLGMPGSPMPALKDIKPNDVGDLANFVLSLSDPAIQAKAQHQRRHIVARKVAGPLPETISDDVWNGSPGTAVALSPLWWRDYKEPELTVAAVHDGKELAVRLTWLDPTRDDAAVRPQDFEDLAAVQLYKGSPEPFLGMGAADRPLDIWLWRAGQRTSGGPADVETQYPNMAVDLYPFEKAVNGSNRHPAEAQDPGFLTARAAGNLNASPAAGGASNLVARGFGTLTLRPRTSQTVRVRGDWKDGRWAVVLRRPLQPGTDGGLALAPGETVSVGFALWDGAARDRNGQKLVSIWHDLQVEE